MDKTVPVGPNARFKTPDVANVAFSDENAANLAANASDIALIIDKRGIVRDVAFAGEEFENDELDAWIGQKWVDLVSSETRKKAEALLEARNDEGQRRWRQVNHPLGGDVHLPIRYFMVPTGVEGWTLALGRDMRAASRMQQRLIEAQQSMERDYARVREIETRFRLLFQIASEGVIIIDGDNFAIVDVNPAAARILGQPVNELENRPLEKALGALASEAVRETLVIARKTGRVEQAEITPPDAKGDCRVSASVFRQERKVFYLLRLTATNAQETVVGAGTPMSRMAEILPDGLILTREDGTILSVNDAFVDLVQLHEADAAIGAAAERYLGGTEVEYNVLIANLREHGVVRNFSTTVQTAHDLKEAVEVSAVAAPGPDGRVFGFSIRPVGRRLVAGRGTDEVALPSTVDQLSDLVGRVPLKEIIRESSDMIERYCIEAALELTNDNRASAAEILGLSRQSLYVKMHRHKIGSLPDKSGNQ